MKLFKTFVMWAVCVVCGSATAQAQLSTILREGLEAAVKGTAPAARKGLQEGVEQSLPKASSLLTKGAIEGVEDMVKTSTSAARVVGREIVEATARHGDELCQTVVAHLGDDGARALSALSKESGERLAELAPDLAKHPQSQAWLKTIAEHGDAAVSWLWKRKASLAVGTVATAVLLQPAEFLEAGEQVVTTAIKTAGEHVMEPLVANGARHVAEPVIREIARPVMRYVAPLLGVAISAFGLAWMAWRCWPVLRRNQNVD